MPDFKQTLKGKRVEKSKSNIPIRDPPEGVVRECHALLTDGALSIILPPFTSSNPELKLHGQKTMEFIAERTRAAHAL